MKLAVGGAFPYPGAAASAGVALGLGTDGASSNNNLDMLEEMKLFALLQKHATGGPLGRCRPPRPWRSPAAGARGCWAGAPLEPGRAGRLPAAARRRRPSCRPATSTPTSPTRRSGSVVDTTVVAGRV